VLLYRFLEQRNAGVGLAGVPQRLRLATIV